MSSENADSEEFVEASAATMGLSDAEFITLVKTEVERRNDNVSSLAEARRHAGRVRKFLTKLLTPSQ